MLIIIIALHGIWTEKTIKILWILLWILANLAIILNGITLVVILIPLIAVITSMTPHYNNKHLIKNWINLEIYKTAHSIKIHGINQIKIWITQTPINRIIA